MASADVIENFFDMGRYDMEFADLIGISHDARANKIAISIRCPVLKWGLLDFFGEIIKTLKLKTATNAGHEIHDISFRLFGVSDMHGSMCDGDILRSDILDGGYLSITEFKVEAGNFRKNKFILQAEEESFSCYFVGYERGIENGPSGLFTGNETKGL